VGDTDSHSFTNVFI